MRYLASEPELTNLTFPSTIAIRNGDDSFKKHLYVNEKCLFPTNVNTWEERVLDAEIKNTTCWLRNFDRKTWSLTIPYEHGGELKELYPDFLFVRSKNGKITVDILDPHNTSLADAPAKAVGLAKYADKHAYSFGRIELITGPQWKN